MPVTHPTARDAAISLVLMFVRSGQARARVSEVTVKRTAVRERLRAAFRVELINAMSELGVCMTELGGGGFGLIWAKSLEAAKPVTAKKWLDPEELRSIRRGKFDYELALAEIRERTGEDTAADDE